LNRFASAYDLPVTQTYIEKDKTMKLSAKPFVLLPLLMSLSHAALAGQVKYVDLTKDDGIYVNDGIVRVSAKNGSFSQPAQATIPFHLRIKAGCEGNRTVGWAKVYYGSENASGTILEASDNFNIDVLIRRGLKDLPYTSVLMNVPINKTGLNPAQMCNQLLQQKKAMGMTEIQFFAKDQVVTKQAQLTGVAQCEKNNNNGIGYGNDKFTTMVKVICEAGGGSPQSNQLQAPKGPIVAVPVGGNNAIQAGEGMNPLTINNAQITTNSLHYSGECPAMKSYTVRMNGSGKGQVRYRIVENGQDVRVSPILDFNGPSKQHNFNLDITTIPAQLNQKINHSFRLFIEVKDQNADSFVLGKQGEYAALNWSQTCLAQANVGGPSSLAPANPMPGPGLKIRAPINTPPQPGQNIRAPMDTPPQPGQNIRAPMDTPPQPGQNIRAPMDTPPQPMNFKANEESTPPPAGPQIRQPLMPKPARKTTQDENN
jgi:hypothetical protein